MTWHNATMGDRSLQVFGLETTAIHGTENGFYSSGRRLSSQEARWALPTVGEHAPASEADLAHIVAGRDHREEDVYGGQVLKLIGQLRAFLGQRLGLGPGPVPYRQSVARSEDTFRHRITHPT